AMASPTKRSRSVLISGRVGSPSRRSDNLIKKVERKLLLTPVRAPAALAIHPPGKNRGNTVPVPSAPAPATMCCTVGFCNGLLIHPAPNLDSNGREGML